jgi:hypothetical protein
LYGGFPTITDLGFLISEISKTPLFFTKNRSLNFRNPTSEINGFYNPMYTLTQHSKFITYMIPIKLSIKGLYSYRETQVVDFTKLTEASIFGIFGKVGSGKSSILEAITFALYGDTERMNKSGDDRNYNMMNLRSDDLLIDFECRAGKDNHLYRFTVKGRKIARSLTM